MKPLSLVILGASGDLTKRLLMPSLFRLHQLGLISKLNIIGYSCDQWNDSDFIEHVHDALSEFVLDFDDEKWISFSKCLSFISGSLDVKDLATLSKKIDGSALFYLALPPTLFAKAAVKIGEAGLSIESSSYWRRILIEKPFGTDLDSAQFLHSQIHSYWNESQVYRIDHFLGKEATLNLMIFRFANRVLAPIWCSEHIEQVQITYAETLGVENRAVYYDHAGAMRDMLQNHLMQLLTLTAIEPLGHWDSEILRDHKVEILKSIRLVNDTNVDTWAARGQYTAGKINDKDTISYRDEIGIPANSNTETFAALRIDIDNWRWRGVPFYLRSGKRLARNYAEIAIQFKGPSEALPDDISVDNNWLVFRLLPNLQIDMQVTAKLPGMKLNTHNIELTAPYTHAGEYEVSAYEQLILDALKGEKSNFLRFDEVEWAWRVIEPIIKSWRHGEPDLYQAGTEGPNSQNKIMQKNHSWRSINYGNQ